MFNQQYYVQPNCWRLSSSFPRHEISMTKMSLIVWLPGVKTRSRRGWFGVCFGVGLIVVGPLGGGRGLTKTLRKPSQKF